MLPSKLGEVVDAQIEQQGVAAFSVTDGTVLVLTFETLMVLLPMAEKEGRVIVFAKRAPDAP